VLNDQELRRFHTFMSPWVDTTIWHLQIDFFFHNFLFWVFISCGLQMSGWIQSIKWTLNYFLREVIIQRNLFFSCCCWDREKTWCRMRVLTYRILQGECS
jgi:hypothetical protein